MRGAWVTGASGFVGGHLVQCLGDFGWRVATARVRAGGTTPAPCAGDVVFHLGGIAKRGDGGLAEVMAANCALTCELYRQASRAGAGGFVFLSTAKVLGERSDAALTTAAPRYPVGAYAQSKAAAERGLLAAHARWRLPLAIVRAPLVYGSGVRGNMRLLLAGLYRGVPLPLAMARGPRSFVSVRNLVDALATVGLALKQGEGVRVWHVTDGRDIDVATLCRTLAGLFGREARLVPLPRAMVDWIARAAAGRVVNANLASSLFDAFRLDDRALRHELGWRPPQSFDEAWAETARWFASMRRQSGQAASNR